nr:hypothetical protein BaRGS_022230 [Batillaria attramentaria]
MTSKKKECPTCRQEWEGHPKINKSLRNIIARMHPEQLGEREQDVASLEDSQTLVENFEKALTKAKEQKKGDYGSFFSGMIIALGIVVIAYLVYYWRGREDNVLVGKPLAAWHPQDVANWLDSMDGHMLMGISDDKLLQLLNVTDSVHQNALQVAIQSIRETGVKMPETLWEYKALYPGRALFLVYALKDFPRTTMLFLYFYDYEDSFLPFLHTTAPREWGVYPHTDTGKLPDPTTFQWLVFLLFMLSFPYGMLGLFAWSLRSVHTLTPYIAIASCVLLTLLDSTFYGDVLCRGAYREWKFYAKQHMKQLLSCIMFGVFWPVTPAFICDVAFYVCLYMSPMQLLKTVRERMEERN